MKKSIALCLLLTACQSSPVQENCQLAAFRACRSAHTLGTREFDNCMKEQKERERWVASQKKRSIMEEQGGRERTQSKENETETQGPQPISLIWGGRD